MRSRRPYRGVDPQVQLQNKSPQPLGFISTIEGKVRQLSVQVAGLKDRLKYKYGKGVPVSYVGESVFAPESDIITVDSARVGQVGAEPCNYVVRDGVLHTVPVIFDGLGVFVARYLLVTFYQRILLRDSTGAATAQIPRQQEAFYEVPQTKYTLRRILPVPTLPFQTGKISLADQVPLERLAADRIAIGTNFFWNLVDRDSDRRLSNDLIPSHILLPGSYQNEMDGDLFEFAVPWLFERAGSIDFQFQLINPILQLDPTSANFPFNGIDDREDNDTVRNQAVTVRVELHGTKFYSERDLLLREAV